MTAIIDKRSEAMPVAGAAYARASEQADPRGPQTLHKPRGLWSYLRVSLSVALLLLMVGLAAVTIVVPALTHSVPMTVLTSSMEPKFPPGTLVIIQPVEAADIRIGDVVTYQIRSGEPEVITHRVTAIMVDGLGERSFTLQGDNNDAPDADPVREVQIQGRLWYSVPLMGWVNTWVNGESRAWIVPIIAGALFTYAGWMVISGIVGGRKKARQQADRRPGRHAA
jgi:signal peptidase